MSTKTKRRRRRNSNSLMRPTKSSGIRRSAKSTTSLARIGTSRADFDHHQDGTRNNQAEDSTAMGPGMEVLNSNSVALDSAISLRHFLVADEGGVVLGDGQPRLHGAVTWKPTSWSR